jgi:hypothetical protein
VNVSPPEAIDSALQATVNDLAALLAQLEMRFLS